MADDAAMQAIESVTPTPAVSVTAPVLHISFVKSGSYFLWKLLDGLFRAAGQKRSFVQNHPIQRLRSAHGEFSIEQFDIDQMLIQDDALYWEIEVQHLQPIRDLRAYLAACSHIWTHSFLCDRSWEVFPRFGRRCYIVRDPRDALVSMANFVLTPYMRRYHPHPAESAEEYVALELERFLADWVRHAGDHVRAQTALDIRMLRYEDMVQDLPTAVRSLADWIGLQIGEEAITAVADSVDLGRMRAKAPQHVRSGRSGGHQDLLTPAQQRRALAIAGPTMRLCGYDV